MGKSRDCDFAISNHTRWKGVSDACDLFFHLVQTLQLFWENVNTKTKEETSNKPNDNIPFWPPTTCTLRAKNHEQGTVAKMPKAAGYLSGTVGILNSRRGLNVSKNTGRTTRCFVCLPFRGFGLIRHRKNVHDLRPFVVTKCPQHESHNILPVCVCVRGLHKKSNIFDVTIFNSIRQTNSKQIHLQTNRTSLPMCSSTHVLFCLRRPVVHVSRK